MLHARRMELTPTGWVANYRTTLSDGRVIAQQRDVESFDADGDAMVVDAERAVLCRARDVPGFVGLRHAERFVVSVLPAEPGWRVVRRGVDEKWTRIIAWLVTERGVAYPMIPDWEWGTLALFDDRLGRMHGPDLEVRHDGAESE